MIPITLNQNTTLLIECLFAGMALLIIALIVWAVIITAKFSKNKKQISNRIANIYNIEIKHLMAADKKTSDTFTAQNKWNHKLNEEFKTLHEEMDLTLSEFLKVIERNKKDLESFKKELTETKYPINQYKKKK